jgi:hypothetical protein
MGAPRPFENPIEAQQALAKLEQFLRKAVAEAKNAQSLAPEQITEIAKQLAKDLMQVKTMVGPQKFNEMLQPANLKVLTEGYSLAASDPKFSYLAQNQNLLSFIMSSPKELASPDLALFYSKFKHDLLEKEGPQAEPKTMQALMALNDSFHQNLDAPLMKNTLFQALMADFFNLDKKDLEIKADTTLTANPAPKPEYGNDLEKTLENQFGSRTLSETGTVQSVVGEVDDVNYLVDRPEGSGSRESVSEMSEEEHQAELAEANKEKQLEEQEAETDVADELENIAEALLGQEEESQAEEEQPSSPFRPSWTKTRPSP